MSATSSPWPDRTPCGPAAPADIDRSCRWPVVLLFALAAGWLVVASTLGLLASLKLHGTQLFAGHAWLTYGRLQPAATNALLYGFALPAGLGVALWLIARLGRVPLRLGGLALVGTVVWNAGVKLGLLGILGGDSTGYEWLEMPRYAAPILFAGYGLIGVSALVTFKDRREGRLYVSQWFLLVALFWFPWIFSTAEILVSLAPLRGVMPAVVAWWYAANLAALWFGFVGLAVLFYLLPTLRDRPLFSQYYAMLAFWVLALFGGWGGVPQSAPLPAWIPAVSTVARLFTLVAVVAVAINLYRTWRPRHPARSRFPLPLVIFSGGAYVLAGLLDGVAALPAVAGITDFTLFTTARTQLFVYGFFAVAMFAAMYHVLPRVLGFALPWPRLTKVHAACAMAGVSLYVVALAVGGFGQGRALAHPEVPFLDTLRPALMALRVGTLGEAMLLVGHLALGLNLAGALVVWGRARCLPVLLAAAKPEIVEATS
jgi:cytochrome c oxidase cbb3-type subunit I